MTVEHKRRAVQPLYPVTLNPAIQTAKNAKYAKAKGVEPKRPFTLKKAVRINRSEQRKQRPNNLDRRCIT